MQSDHQAQATGEIEPRDRTPERVTPQAHPDRAGGIAGLEERDEEVLDFLQDHRTSHNREEPYGIAVRPQDERQIPNMTINHVSDVAVHDHDAEQKATAKMYTDAKRGHEIQT